MLASRRWPRQQDCAMCGVSASVCRRPPASRCMQGWHKKGRERQRKISYDRMGADGAVATVGHDLAAAGLVRLNGFLRLIHHPDQRSEERRVGKEWRSARDATRVDEG